MTVTNYGDLTLSDCRAIRKAFQMLMGINGDRYADEIVNTGALSPKSYSEVCENVSYNGQFSVFQYFGVIQWYRYQYDRKYRC